MSLTYTSTYRVRHYECDAYGHVNNSNYLRYMQEAAYDASAEVGYDLARFENLSCLWLAHDTEIEYLLPLRYGDSVEVKTWIEDFRHLQSYRAYELRRVKKGDVIARARTNWVFADAATRRPVPVPAELVTAFFPAGAPAPLPRKPFPASTPPDNFYALQRRVVWQDIDVTNHVNNAAYLAYVEDCGFQSLAALGWPVRRIWSEGYAIIPRSHQIEYSQSAVLDDILEISVWVTAVKSATLSCYFTIRRQATRELLARVQTVYVWLDRVTVRPTRVPTAFLADLHEAGWVRDPDAFLALTQTFTKRRAPQSELKPVV